MSSDRKDDQYFTLSNGVLIPKIGLGCAFGNWADPSKPAIFQPDLGWKAMRNAIDAGVKLYDTAFVYGSHQVVGNSLGLAFADGKIVREDVFVQTKVFHFPAGLALNRIGNSIDMEKYAKDPSLDIKERVLHDIEKSLFELNLGYVDLLLMHWPGYPNSTDREANLRLRKQVWSAFEEVYKTGKVRAIGVSNFLVQHFEGFLEECKILPMVNQLEVSPYMAQAKAVEYCQSKGILVQAWGAFGSGATGVLQDPVINEIAAKYKKNAGQVILRFFIQKGIAIVPKSGSLERMKSNIDVFDFQLTDEEVQRIFALDQNKSSVIHAEIIA
jgi:diketogulonate reductase-like aldo/keto reductase